jgi:hypothetical protein
MPDLLSSAAPIHEPFIGAKELPDALLFLGVRRVRKEWAAQRLIKAMRESGAPVACRYTVRASDAAAWILEHPQWSPYSMQRTSAGVLSIAS